MIFYPTKNTETFNKSGFFIAKIRLAFTELRQVFIEAPNLCHFDPECYIQFEIDIWLADFR